CSVYVNLSRISLLRIRQEAKATAKLRTFSHIFQIFPEVFFLKKQPGKTENRNKPFKQRRSLAESGCKSTPYSHKHQILTKVFSENYKNIL
ncbi:hypothetical protein, partial [Mediterranea sp. An20]|uniref:hypothetical protein n=1 Tax=Mediterranea sp. An20 TaxID=1965586 RepID=UPI00195045BC